MNHPIEIDDRFRIFEPRDRTEPERRARAYWNHCDLPKAPPKWPDKRNKASKRSGHRHVAAMLGMCSEPSGLVRIDCKDADTACRYRDDLYGAMRALGLLGAMTIWRTHNTVVIRKAPARAATRNRGNQNSHDKCTPNRRDCQWK